MGSVNYTMHREKVQLIAHAEGSPSKPHYMSLTTDHGGSGLWCNSRYQIYTVDNGSTCGKIAHRPQVGGKTCLSTRGYYLS